MTILDNRTFYDQDATSYDARWGTKGGSRTDKTQRQIVADLCSGWSGKNVLEIGCGTGRFSVVLAQIGARLTLADLSSKMLEVTREKLSQNGLAQAVVKDANVSIYDLGFDPGTFDSVVSLNVFNHLEKIDLALAECVRVLKKDGAFLFNYPNLYSYYWPVAEKINKSSKAVGQEVYSNWMKPLEMKKKLKNAGFEIEQMVGHVHVPRALERFGINSLFYGLDRISRHKPLLYLAPVHYCLCKKV